MTSLHDEISREINAHDAGRCLPDCHVCRKRSDDMQRALLLFLRGEQSALDASYVAEFMVRIGFHGSPPASQAEWSEQLDTLVADGRVTADGDSVQVVRTIAEIDDTTGQPLLF